MNLKLSQPSYTKDEFGQLQQAEQQLEWFRQHR